MHNNRVDNFNMGCEAYWDNELVSLLGYLENDLQYKEIVMLKNKMQWNYCLAETVAAGSTSLSIRTTADDLAKFTSEITMFFLGPADPSYEPEVLFFVRELDFTPDTPGGVVGTATIEIDTDINLPGLQGVLANHPRNGNTSDHFLSDRVAGIDSRGNPDFPTFITMEEDNVDGWATIAAHELMHKRGLRDVDEAGNLMFWVTGDLDISEDLPLRYYPVQTHYEPAEENQWESTIRPTD